MSRKISLVLVLVACIIGDASAQKSKPTDVDTAFIDYDTFFNELDALLDSLATPRNFALINVGVGNNYFDYESNSSFLLKTKKKLTITPGVAFFSKTGLGISITSMIMNDGKKLNPYQYYATASYDYLKNPHFLTGLAFTDFFTKDSLPFYTSPLKNEVYAYFTYKKFWLKPAVAASYGWGNRSSYNERQDYITSLRLATSGYTRINTQESVNDFNLIVSVRHDFYWLDVLTKGDYVRLTPQIIYTSGTQRYGFNQTSNSYALPKAGPSVLYNSDNATLNDQQNFQPLSVCGVIKAEYAKGKFFFQPELLLDYFFPANNKNLSTAFVVNAGVIF